MGNFISYTCHTYRRVWKLLHHSVLNPLAEFNHQFEVFIVVAVFLLLIYYRPRTLFALDTECCHYFQGEIVLNIKVVIMRRFFEEIPSTKNFNKRAFPYVLDAALKFQNSSWKFHIASQIFEKTYLYCLSLFMTILTTLLLLSYLLIIYSVNYYENQHNFSQI